MKKNIILFIGIIMVLLSCDRAFARCSDAYADDLIQERFGKNCIAKIHGAKEFNSACGEQIEEVCSNGCYMPDGEAMINECRQRFANVLLKGACANFITKITNNSSGDCTDSRRYPGVNMDGPDKNCEWEVMKQSEFTCGSKDKILCSGDMICHKDFKVNGERYDKGPYSMGCFADGKDCKTMSMEKCFLDPNVTVSDEGSINLRNDSGLLNERLYKGSAQ